MSTINLSKCQKKNFKLRLKQKSLKNTEDEMTISLDNLEENLDNIVFLPPKISNNEEYGLDMLKTYLIDDIIYNIIKSYLNITMIPIIKNPINGNINSLKIKLPNKTNLGINPLLS